MIDAIKIQLTAPQRMREGVDAICPIDAFTSQFSLGELVGKFTPAKTATKQQIAEAQAFIDSFDWQDEAATQAFIEAKEPAIKDIKDSAIQMVNDIDAYIAIADTATAVQVRAEVKALDQRMKRLIKALARIAQQQP